MKVNGKKKLKVGIGDKTLWKRFLQMLGVVSSLVTFISFFFSTDQLCMNTWILVGSFSALVFSIFVAMWIHANRKCCAIFSINQTKIRVVEGDIWELYNRQLGDRTGEISVIGVNEFFDVTVDDRIVASNSLHGQYIKRITQDGKLDDLIHTIECDPILNKPCNHKTVSSRKFGRQTRYELGSVVEFESYVLTAFTRFDSDNKAWLSTDEYVKFWMRFWENIDKIYAGRTINIPLMGAGITRFKSRKPSKQELLELMLWAFKMSGFHNSYSDKQINFVIYPDDVTEIDFYHIQHNYCCE